jgi:hypothetical protein
MKCSRGRTLGDPRVWDMVMIVVIVCFGRDDLAPTVAVEVAFYRPLTKKKIAGRSPQ